MTRQPWKPRRTARQLDYEQTSLINRLDGERGPEPPSPARIEARKRELQQYAEDMRLGFPAPIIVNGILSHYAVIRHGRIVGHREIPPPP